MWNEINTESDLTAFMQKVCYFHDSCIKELKYTSGAYVTKELSMHPINTLRTLRMIIQRQYEDIPVIEMKFEKIKFLSLFPAGDTETCEILGSSMFIKDNLIYWCDQDNVTAENYKTHDCTIICAAAIRWREVKNVMEEAEYYSSNI